MYVCIYRIYCVTAYSATTRFKDSTFSKPVQLHAFESTWIHKKAPYLMAIRDTNTLHWLFAVDTGSTETTMSFSLPDWFAGGTDCVVSHATWTRLSPPEMWSILSEGQNTGASVVTEIDGIPRGLLGHDDCEMLTQQRLGSTTTEFTSSRETLTTGSEKWTEASGILNQ